MNTPQLPAYLRTFVPILWGYLVGLLATNLPGVSDLLDTLGVDLNSPEAVAAVTGLAAIGWYALLRKLEKYLPDIVTRFLLGSPQTPAYDGSTAGGPLIEAAGPVFELGDAEQAMIEVKTGQSADPNLTENQPTNRDLD